MCIIPPKTIDLGVSRVPETGNAEAAPYSAINFVSRGR
jgi:hypothetical protein